MELTDFSKQLQTKHAELSTYFRRSLPIKAGAKVKSIVQENFRLGGFQNGSLDKWKETGRQQSGNGADSQRGPLLSSRKVLYGSTGYKPGNASVTIYNNVIYAGIHNEGGVTHPRVTPKMRRYAWARYYEETKGKGKGKGGKDRSDDSSFWKGMALTKKETLNVRIPRRQFMGPSRTVDAALHTMIEQDLRTILDK